MSENNKKKEQKLHDVEESNAAKLLRIKGSETGEDRIHDESATVTEYNKAENFWYHHKWAVIFVAFFLVCAIVLIPQFGNAPADSSVMFAGPYVLGETTEEIRKVFTSLMEDYNEDGDKVLRFTSMRCYSDEQLAILGEETDADGNKYKNSTAFANLLNSNHQECEAFYKIVFLDEFVIYLVDPFLYEEVKAADGWLPLSEVFDYTVEQAIDDTGIRFADTAFAQYYSCFAELPEDTVLCIRRVSTVSNKKGKIRHGYNVDLFRAIVEFVPES